MKRAFGASLLIAGLLPMLAIIWVWLIWARHMYTVGLSADTRGWLVLGAFVILELACLSGGALLLFQPKRISD
jgi:heme/copper-type cytochrome/quinol oxidase subunit 1